MTSNTQPTWADDETRPEGWYWWACSITGELLACRWQDSGWDTVGVTLPIATEDMCVGGDTLIGPAHPPAPTDTALAERIEAVLYDQIHDALSNTPVAGIDVTPITQAILSEIETSINKENDDEL